ncbi:SWI/SNF-related matrix-associated actin-dependent regulator of chromatin subfamily A containing DEAD/H box 1-like [Rhincodon typus]|uniref:SWI/SNF-related matrix-associated actin-dependent regulator of chromatin subfamily A containing DEAD/H box 1-like n=1 Tax=Rhincodon typus TaxID=259920 RepID=UPI00202F8683|nr:SWI/SNF-related matrix-associated actin-dependent regulator of chromatin subfamily A containing DEAD/H box 1-like [Rhincodon typus]
MSSFNLDRFRYEKKRGANGDRDLDRQRDTPRDSGLREVDGPAVTIVPETPEGKQSNFLSYFRRKEKGVLFLDSESETEETCKKNLSCQAVNGRPDGCIQKLNNPVDFSSGEDEQLSPKENGSFLDSSGSSHSVDMGDSIASKVQKLTEIFPNRTDAELLQIIESTSTLDGAVAAGLILFGEAVFN